MAFLVLLYWQSSFLFLFMPLDIEANTNSSDEILLKKQEKKYNSAENYTSIMVLMCLSIRLITLDFLEEKILLKTFETLN